MLRLDPGTQLHLIGIGGIGMSGLARICAERGLRVTGCDIKLNGTSQRLREQGVPVQCGHHPSHLSEAVGLVVYSAAVPEEEPELREAKARGIPTMTRGALLAELARPFRLIGVAGSHGKTTTSAMAAQLLVHAGWDPTAIVGGMVRGMGGNARYGRGRYLVAETDESDGSFLLLKPEVAVVTNVDREHLNYYQHLESLIDAFAQFAATVPPDGTLIRCEDDPVVRRLPRHPRQLTYGLCPTADVTADRLMFEGHGAAFRPRFRGRPLGTFELHVPGRINVLNALAVIGLGLTLDLPLITIQEALAAFRGTERRFQLFRLPRDIWVVEDYAHHPAEIEATLEADAVRERHRLVVFQPHRFSRTQALEREFTTCFDRADGVIVTDIYPASEPPIPGVSGQRLARLIKAHGHPWVRYVPREALQTVIRDMAYPGDTIFFLGAGDIGEICHAMADELCDTARAAQ